MTLVMKKNTRYNVKLSATSFETLYSSRDNRNIVLVPADFTQECIVFLSLLCRTRESKCVLVEVFEHASPRRRGARRSAAALFYFARRHEKRAVFIFQFAPAKLLFGDQIEQTFAGSGFERRFWRVVPTMWRGVYLKSTGS